MRSDLFWIPGPWRGRLAIASRPRGGDWLEAEAAGWRDSDVDAIVSLLEKDEATQLDLLQECRAAEDNGMHYISFAIPDRDVPASTRDALSLMTHILAELEAGKNVAVHCRQGIGRSGLIGAGVLMTAGASPSLAIRTVSTARGVAIPETRQQLRWIERRQLPTRSPRPEWRHSIFVPIAGAGVQRRPAPLSRVSGGPSRE